jgi:hypothetical protein
MGRLTISALLGAAGLLLASGCSSGHPGGAAAGSQPASSPGASQTAVPGSSTPAPTPATVSPAASSSHAVGAVTVPIRVGRFRFLQEFAAAQAASPAQALVVARFRQAEVLWEESDMAGQFVTPVQDYVTGSALQHLELAIAGAHALNAVPAGRDVMYMTRVTDLTSTQATLTTCDNGSHFQSVNRQTGKPDAALAPPADQQFLFETWHLTRLASGWALSTFNVASLPSPSAKACQAAA